MSGPIKLLKSGFKFIDVNWGGLYKGGSYLIVGQKKSGRTLLSLKFAHQFAVSKDICLLFTGMRPKDLMIQAASLNIDLQEYMDQNQIIVVRIAPPNYIYDVQNMDDYLIEYFNDIITVVNQYKPNSIIFDEITPYIGFRNIDLLRDSFLHTLEIIEEKDITSFFIVGEPATPKAQSIVDVLANYVTAVIALKKFDKKIDDRYHGGIITITPNVGHPEGQFSDQYRIEPRNGVTVDVEEPEEEKKAVEPEAKEAEPLAGSIPSKNETEEKNRTEDIVDDSLYYSNVYSYNDFLLILNNQIALFQSTGKKFNLLVFKLDPGAQVKGLLSLNQLQNSVRNATDKKDKICVQENKIMILVVDGTEKRIQNLTEKMKSHFPSSDPDYMKAVQEFISVMKVEVNNNITNSELMMDYIETAESKPGKAYVPLNQLKS